MLFIQRRQHLFQRCVGFQEFFETHQLRNELLQLAHIFGWREQEQNRVEIAFLRDNPVLAQEVSQDGGGHAEIIVLTGTRVDSRRREQ
ncbi:hypothetical protein D3C80_1652740 [compost metagenome]